MLARLKTRRRRRRYPERAMITIKWSDSVVEEEEEKGEKGQRDAKVGMEDRGNLAGSNKVKYL